MGKAHFVPITPSVLRWALHESGYDEDSLSAEIEVSVDELRGWLDGSAQPSKTKFDALTTKLRRPSALFFLPQAPTSTLPAVHFRRPHGVTRRNPSPKELRYLREASRLQATMSWVSREVGVPAVSLPDLATTTNIEAAALKISAFLLDGSTLSRRLGSPAKIQAEWRNRLEARGVFVLMLPLGQESVRGFSLYDEFAPLLAVNTHWDYRPRVFTMLHEFNHLVSRTSSACVETLQQRLPDHDDNVERWCEQVAAAVLMPWPDMTAFLSRDLRLLPEQRITSLEQLYRISRHFGTSVRATALRLIGRERAGWSLYRQIPSTSEHKPGSGGGGRVRKSGRTSTVPA